MALNVNCTSMSSPDHEQCSLNTMAEMELHKPTPERKREFLELELAEKLARENGDNVDELQLAALLGKTLLEKNGDLELKLRRLQDFAEETLISNQTLTRQLNESRDSLQFSNKLCEQLEQKIEELERTNEGLQKFRDSRKGLIEQKDAMIRELEEKLEALQKDYISVKEHCESLEQSQVKDVPFEEVVASHKTARSISFSGVLRYSSPPRAEIQELQDTVDDLMLKLQNANYQKQKLENDFKEVFAENQTLGKTLEVAEAEAAELQAKVKSFEEASERQSLEGPITSPRIQGLTTSTPTCGSSFLFQSHSPRMENNSTHLPLRSPKVASAMEGLLGASLFSELDSQYSMLQRQYEDLLHRCTCSASLAYKNKHQVSVEQDEAVDSQPVGKTQGQMKDRPFKELFDEVFATLKQTAQVADRLIERRNRTSIS